MFRGSRWPVNLSMFNKSTISDGLGRIGWWLVPARCALCEGAAAAPRLDLCAFCCAALPREPIVWHPETLPFAAILSPWRYSYPVDAMIRALKFQGERCYARVLGELLAQQRQAVTDPLPDQLIPLPLHPRRLAQRGYNQADEIARFAARSLSLPVTNGLLQRVKATREQSSLSAVQRRVNVRGAFHATGTLAGRRVALVDDVITTGSTAAAAAAALKMAGAVAVELWTLARVTRSREVQAE